MWNSVGRSLLLFYERLRSLIRAIEKQNKLKFSLLLSQGGRTLSLTVLSACSMNRIRRTYRLWKSRKGKILLWKEDTLNVFSNYRKRGNEILFFPLMLTFRMSLSGNYWKKKLNGMFEVWPTANIYGECIIF